jgi:signal transduction histidine kinase
VNVTQNIETEQTRDLKPDYTRALEDYLSSGGEEALQRAYEIGRTSLTGGVSLLEMAATHHTALAQVLQRMRHAQPVIQELERAQEFFGESLSPYEMAHRGFRDAILALQQLNATLEQEIQRIAHAVHDEAGQLLVAARLAMSGVARDLNPPLRERLQEVGTILDQVEKQLRRLSHELRPTILDDLGLVPALQFLTDGISRRMQLSIRIQSSLQSRYDPNVETVLYRIVQEALTNVAKHAHAKNVEIQLTNVNKNLHCEVHDDGVGFDVPSVLSCKERRGLGLLGIRERLMAVGGTLQIDSRVGQGTELLVNIPVEK